MTWILGRDGWLSRRLAIELGGLDAAAEEPRCALLDGAEHAEGALADIEEGAVLVVTGSSLVDDRGLPSPASAARLFAASARCRPAAVVVVSSFAAHDPSHRHPGLVAEGFRAAARMENRVAAAWREIESGARQAFAGCCPLTLLRASATPAPDGGCVIVRRLRARVAAIVPGHDPQIQLLDVQDLARAVAVAVALRPAGPLHVAPSGAIPLRAALRLAGRVRLPVPLALQRAARRLARFGRRAAARRRVALDELDYLRFPATQSDAALRELGYAPRWSSAEAVLRLGSGGTGCPKAVGGEPPPAFDDDGLSPSFVRAAGRTVFRFLRRIWFRAEIEGTVHVPARGPAVLAGTHRGFVPLDAMLALDALVRERGRWPRFLVHPGLLRWPWISMVITRLGGVVACRENAERLLARGEVVGVFPEGLAGPFRLLREAHRVGRFLSDDFVDWARRHRAPLVPFVTDGAAEALPILGRIDWRWWRRRTEWPFLPITPTTPLLPIPLPVKWRMRFFAPLDLESGPDPGADRREVSRVLRATLQRELDALRALRRGARGAPDARSSSSGGSP